ncbi:hypothetical protein N9N67_12065 [Bacteriovoracaceae bacterium]|nr:hypothetical protein [Bacteriovoracaceae bacterium]
MSNRVLKFENCEFENIFDKEFNTATLHFFGDIDREFPIELPLQANLSKINLYLKNLRLLNSAGIKNFILLMEFFNKKRIKVSFHECPPSFILQCSSVMEMVTPQRVVKSLFLPYINEENNEEILILQNASDLNLENFSDERNHEGTELSFNHNPKLFLNFLTYQNK